MSATRRGWALILSLSLVSCSPAVSGGNAVAAAETLPPVQVRVSATSNAVLVTPSPAIPRSTPVQLDLPTGGSLAVSAWRPPPYPVPWVVRPGDHFYFGRPIASGEVNWPNAQYRYGATFFGIEPTHTGVDFGAARGTAVLAAGPGEVVWTGYGLYRGVERADDPYGQAIAIRHDFGHEGQRLFTVYAHLSRIDVWVGQRVDTGDPIGAVGETGHATGAHLHFEVRLGENDYFSTRNPELWMVPPEGWGVLAGQILDSSRRRITGQPVRIISLDSGQLWDVWTYAPETVHSDEIYQENFVISDLPAGAYRVESDYVGKTFAAEILLLAGQTNLVDFRGRSGFIVEPTATAVPLLAPPIP